MTDDAVDAAGPLAGVRILDVTEQLGRFAGKVLAELGADVVRLRPGERGPDLAGPDQLGLLDLWHDVGCRQAALDLDSGDGAAAFRRLVERCDILLEAEAAGVMAARGLGPETLAGLNDRLVHVSLTPQGANGPRAGWRSSDLVAQALGGYLSVTGDPDQPVAIWGRQAATVGGLYAAVSALAGLRRARITGRGSWIDLSLHEALVSCSEHVLMYWWFPEALSPLGAPIAPRQRSLHWVRAFEVVPCQRGACMVSPAAGGMVDLIAWLHARGHARSVPAEPEADQLLMVVAPLMEALRAVARESDATELFETGQSLHVPFGEAYSIAQVASCEQLAARRFFRPVEGGPAVSGDLRLPGPIARLEATPGPGPRPPVAVTAEAVEAEWSVRAAGDGGAASAGTGDELAPPLAGIRVLDLTHVLAGPFASRLLADLGADVIRIQTDERSAGASGNDFPYNIMWARTKRSIQLHMRHERSIEVLRRLVEQADVVIDNFSAGVMDSWGAGPAQLAEWNPRIISMSMTGCGADGPWQEYVTYAPTVHALCGLTALTGPPGETDCGPGIAFNDHASGLAGATSVLAALEVRERTGRGQHIDLSQLEIGTYLVGPALVRYLATGEEHRSDGNADPFADHLVNDVFRGADGQWLAVTVFDENDWLSAAALEALAVDPAAAGEALARWVAERPAAEAQETLQGAGLAAGLVQNARHLAEDDPQLAHRDWLVVMDSSLLGIQTTERHPGRWFNRGRAIELPYRASAYLGEHNFDVYEQLLGWDAADVAEAIGDELIL